MTQQNIIPNSINETTSTTSKSNTLQDNFTLRGNQAKYALPPSPVSPSFSLLQSKSTLPAFLNKLYGMVNSSETDPWVHWNEAGDAFLIPNTQTLAEQVLGRHFKHNNFASFVRQLNMYGFHKVQHLNHGVLHNDGTPEVWEFVNENFLRDDPSRMKFIVRKKGEAEKARSAARQQVQSTTPTPQPHLNDPADIAIARAEIQSVATRQNMIREEVLRLANSTEGLWKYALETRRRYEDQQNKLDKVIKVLSEAFRKRVSNTEIPNKVRGLLEGPSVFEELSDSATPVQTPGNNVEQGQLDVMKMIANGKMPMGLQEAIQHYLQNIGQGNILPQTPMSPISPPSFDSSDALTMYQTANNAQSLAQVQDWVDHTDNNLAGLGIDLNNASNMGVDYSEYLNGSHFAFDAYQNPDPSMDMFGAGDSSEPWMSEFLNSDQDNHIIGQKRAMEDEQEESRSSAKKPRI